MMHELKQLARRARHAVHSQNPVHYWEQRAIEYGPRSVMNLGYDASACEAATRKQRDVLIALLRPLLSGRERVALDIGCGPGRFTRSIAELIDGWVIGVDPVHSLLEAAPLHDRVEYRLMKPGVLPVEDDSIDLVWICLVLGGITQRVLLDQTLCEVFRVLREGGLVLLVENTSQQPDHAHWNYRSVQAYQSMFPFAELRCIGGYEELGEQISVFAGRKRVSGTSLASKAA